MDRGWSPALKAFAQYEGGDVLDAAVLLMPLVKFISPTDPKWQTSPDGLRGAEGHILALLVLVRRGVLANRTEPAPRCP